MSRSFEPGRDDERSQSAFDALRTARPSMADDLTDPDGPRARAIWREILEDQPELARRTRRVVLRVGLGAVAAAAAIAALVVVPGRQGAPASGRPAVSPEAPPSTVEATLLPPTTSGPQPTSPPSAPIVPTVPITAALPSSWPVIASADPVGDAMTAQATVSFESGSSVWHAVVTLADGALLIGMDTSDGGTSVSDERLFVDGHWYEPTPDGWQPDPSPTLPIVRPTPSDPRELLDRLTPTAGFEPDGTHIVDGIETVHLRAMTPGAIDPALLALLPTSADTSIGSLELWVDSNRITRRIDVVYVDGDDVDGAVVGADGTRVIELESSSVSIVFSAVGEPIALDPATTTQR